MMRRISCKWISDEVEMMVSNCKGKLELDGLVASEGRRSIDSVGSDYGSVQHDSRLDKMICLTSDSR